MNKNIPPPPHQGSPPPLPLPPHQRQRRTPPWPPPFPTPAVALARDAALATAATAAAAAANAVPAIPPRPVADAISNAFLDRTNARSGVSLNGRVAASFHRVKNAVLKNYEGTVTDEELGEQVAHLTASSLTSAVAGEIIPITVIDHHVDLTQLMTKLSGQMADLQTGMTKLQTDVTKLQTDVTKLEAVKDDVTLILQTINAESSISDRNSVARIANSHVRQTADSLRVVFPTVSQASTQSVLGIFPKTYFDYLKQTETEMAQLLILYGYDDIRNASSDILDDMLRCHLGLNARF
jgi:hypothetical protein